jgi:hypothetical protein
MSLLLIAWTTLLGTIASSALTPAWLSTEAWTMLAAPSPPWASSSRAAAGSTPQQVDRGERNRDRDRRDHHGVGERAQADRLELANLAHLGDPDHQRREQQRQHEHEQQPEEDLPDRPGDVSHDPRDPRGIARERVGGEPGDQAEKEAEQDAPLQPAVPDRCGPAGDVGGVGGHGCSPVSADSAMRR